MVEFQIIVSASGTTSANNVNLIDVLPNNFNLNFVTIDSSISQGSGLNFNLGNMSPGTSKTVRLTTTLASESNFPCNSSWINNASASGSNVSTVNDNAIVIVTKPGVCGQLPSLSINKQVRNITANTSFQDSVSARASERLEFRIIVTNNGSVTALNARVIDSLPSALTYVFGTLRLDGSTGFNGDLFSTNLLLGNMSVGQSRTITFEATAPAVITTNAVYNNAATATADNVNPVTDTATVTVSAVLGGNIDLLQSKRAFNQTKNQNATTVVAQPGDVIVYTLSVQNRGNAPATNFVFDDEIRDVLEMAELVDFGDAAFNFGAYRLTWPAITIPAGGTVEKIFTVRIRPSFPAGDCLMINSYGNSISVAVACPRIGGVFVAPKTGSTLLISLGMGFLSTLAYAAKRRKVLAPLLQLNRSRDSLG
jgi:uncharacterized repeat protein (TIGR01451 family)